MKIRVIAYSILIFLTVLIQSTIADSIKIYGVKPNIIIVVTVIVALLRDETEGAVIGFLCGLIQDAVSGRVIGFYALLGLYLGLIIGKSNKKLNKENVLISIFFTFISTLIYESIVYFFTTVLRAPLDFVHSMKNIILIEAIYNSVISIIVFIIVSRMNKRFEEYEKNSRRY